MDTDQENTVSVVVTAGNEERHIGPCLDTATWADEIVVVDSCSTDRTVEVARRYTDRVFNMEWRGYVGQKRYAMTKASCRWILFLDADERISPELRDEIARELEQPAVSCVGFRIPRKVFYMGRWIRHGDWYPDHKLRLFRRDLGEISGSEPHDKVRVRGPVKRLSGDLLHYTYSDITDHLDTVNRFSSIAAEDLFRRGVRAGLVAILLRPAVRFIRSYVVRLGFLDGFPGLIAALTVSYGVFAKYAKLREMHISAHAAADDATRSGSR